MIEALAVVLMFCCWTCGGETNPVAVEDQNLNCPPWYYQSRDGNCLFSKKLAVVQKFGNTSELQLGHCMTEGLNSTLVVSQCPYSSLYNHNFSQYHISWIVLPNHVDQLNKVMCGVFNRRGFLCSKCEDNYGIAAYRYSGLVCVECTGSMWSILAYIGLLFGPTTALFLTFLIFNINVHSGRLTGIIFFSHTLTSVLFFYPSLIIPFQFQFGYWPIQFLFSLYGVWSLNFLQFLIPPFCVSPHLTTLQLICLGYVPSLYSLVLCIAMYHLIESHDRGNRILVKAWKPFHRLFTKFKHKPNARFSVIHTFGTIIALSYGKNVFITFTLLQGYIPVELELSTNILHRLPMRSVDLNIPYLSPTHVPYAVLGIVGGVLTVILPLVLVLIFPTRVFPKLIPCCGLRRWHAMRTFMEVFTSSYKDGTKTGQRDYRFTAAVYLCGRVVLGIGCFIHGAQYNIFPNYSWVFAAVGYAVGAIGFLCFKPYRKAWHNATDTLLLLLLSKICLCSYFYSTASEYISHVMIIMLLIDLAIPQVALITYLSYKLVSWMYAQDVRGLISALRRRRNQEQQSFQANQQESQPLLKK